MKKRRATVMVSSTARDLPDYRQQVMDACLRADMFPKMMEQLPALDADAIEASLAMVDEADVYVGLFAHRYGYVPEGHDISVTHMEHERAVERGIPRLIFVIDDDVPVKPKDIDMGDAAEKLKALKTKLLNQRVVNFFKTPEDLRGLAVHALTEIKKQLDKDEQSESDANDDGDPDRSLRNIFHHVSTIPTKDQPYIAHPYTLLQVRGLVGRKRELEILTDWITKPSYRDTTIFNIVAIGSMGKSALTWTWFNNIAPQEKKWAGRVWWSFYESDASFENFVTRTLAYVTGRPLEEFKNILHTEQQSALLNHLNQAPYLLVLDGLERILIAYAKMNAAYLQDDDVMDEETANFVADIQGLPQSAGQSFVGKHKLRKTADVRAGQFLRKLAQLRQTRVLVSTRLYPADIQSPTGQLYPRCSALFLKGLSDQDALDLWRAYGAKGSRETMLPIFNTFDKHPLLIQLLAYEVANFRDAPGDFDAWRKVNADFDPFNLPIVQVQSEVLSHALKGLSEAELRTLHVIAGFRMPASMETVKALLIRTEKNDDENDQKPFSQLSELDRALSILEDRGLLGWDRQANRYDLHPIVRGVVWNRLDDASKRDIYGSLQSHFEAMPMLEDYLKVESVEDLSPAIELYNILIGQGRYEEAFEIFRDRLDDATLYRLSASRLRVEMLEPLFPEGLDKVPRLSRANDQAYILNSLAQGHLFGGQPSAALKSFELAINIFRREDDQNGLAIVSCNQSSALRVSGNLYKAELAARHALIIGRRREDSFQESVSLYLLGLTLAIRGIYNEGMMALQRALGIWIYQKHHQLEGLVNAYLAKQALWQGKPTVAKKFADRAWDLARVERLERDFIRAARLQGTAALQLENWGTAKEKLQFALTRARGVQLIEEELPILVALAALCRQQQNPEQARERLDEVWELAERGPYPTFHADALNVLAQLEQDAGNTETAIEAATEAYKKAWCDGSPFTYDYGLRNAKKLLETLGAPELYMPPFDQSKFEPMPEVEINPDDEYGGE